jgi:hypothetical protein
MSVSCEWCVLSGRGLCDGWSRSPTECSVSECDREASIMRRPWPTRCCRAMEKKIRRKSIDRIIETYNIYVTTNTKMPGLSPWRSTNERPCHKRKFIVSIFHNYPKFRTWSL